ncbi:MAG: endonuclease III domain-containing protein [Planctomycetes bacterium]|nr:endonuclease III domain-containing protein [Planctomycetota bacterium]
MLHDKLMQIYDLLLGAYGCQGWWPGSGCFETIVGAILTQNTNWANAEKAIDRLKGAGVLDAEKLYYMDQVALADLIRPAGYYNIKAGRLKNFIDWLYDYYDGDLGTLASMSAYSLRDELLSIKGIGRETADSILLYAFDKPVFVIDTYTARVLIRHGLIEQEADYEQLRDLFESSLPQDTKLYNEFHALLVRVGKNHCKPTPKCNGCPLEYLPHETQQAY